MKGDFSRIRFDATKRYSRVLQQQGRVTLDAATSKPISCCTTCVPLRAT